MIKRIIFDLDGTLIVWKNHYIRALEKTMRQFNINENVRFVDKVISDYENKYKYLNKQTLLSAINNVSKEKIDMDFIEELLDKQKDLAEPDSNLSNVLDYLSSKYELVILSNWFEETQVGRLKTAGIYKYFKEFYCADKYYLKPDSRAFASAMGDFKVSECLMVGDSYTHDIRVPLELGMKVIMVDYSGINKSKEYKVINKIEELKDLL